jgi:hypothetical protein
MEVGVKVKLAIVAQMTIRISGVLLLALGVFIWTGNFDQLIPYHRILGFVLVIALWALSLLAARAGVPIGLVVAAAVWGLIAPIIGLTQASILTGGFHWVIQVIHLVIGLGAIGWGERLGQAMKSRTPVAAPQKIE